MYLRVLCYWNRDFSSSTGDYIHSDFTRPFECSLAKHARYNMCVMSNIRCVHRQLRQLVDHKISKQLKLSSHFRILGHRVAELEKKLKTLEVSGLWSLQGLWFHITVNHLFKLFVVFACG